MSTFPKGTLVNENLLFPALPTTNIGTVTPEFTNADLTNSAVTHIKSK